MAKVKKEDIKKVVLAYSGGLDTSVIIPWSGYLRYHPLVKGEL